MGGRGVGYASKPQKVKDLKKPTKYPEQWIYNKKDPPT